MTQARTLSSLLLSLSLSLASTASAQAPAIQDAPAEKVSAEKKPSAPETPTAEAAKTEEAAETEEATKTEEAKKPAATPPKIEPMSKDSALEEMAEDEAQGDSQSNAASETKKEKSVEDAKVSPPEKKPTPLPAPQIDYSKLPWTYHQKRFDLGAGLLIGWSSDPAFDLFQSKNGYATWEARGAVGFWASGPLSLAVTAKYNDTSIEGEVRGLPSFLSLGRVHAGGEARYHFIPRVYAYGRLDVGAFLARSRLGEADSPTRMELKNAGFSGGLHLGGAVRVAGSPDGRSRAPRLHLFAEGGLEYDSPLDLTYEMVSEGALRPAPVDLGTLSTGGPRIALGALVSY